MNSGQTSSLGVRPDSVDKAACGNVFEEEEKHDEKQQGVPNQKQLARFLREPKPLQVVREIDELALTGEAEAFSQNDHRGQCNDNRRETKGCNKQAVESPEQCTN